MNIVKITNRVALATVFLLMYWVFIFVCSSVFGFKVFKENMTEVFLLSILGIFSLLVGSIILNIMFNLTAIAEGRGGEKTSKPKQKKTPLVLFSLSFVLIFALLYLGDLATSKKKEAHLVNSASSLVEEQKQIISEISDFSFSKEGIENISSNIKFLSKIEEKFPKVTIIIKDQIKGKPVLLGFNSYMYVDEEKEPEKVDFILGTSSEERNYLHSIFSGNNSAHRFSSNDGKYEIYFPFNSSNKTIVIHLSQHSRYGKIGS